MLLSGVARAQSGVFPYRWNGAPPTEAITPTDIREALIWTGHLDYFYTGGVAEPARRAAQAWQKAKGYQPTDSLTDEQTKELILQGLKERDSVGWANMRDPAVGFVIGAPTKLVTFETPRIDGNSLIYYGGGSSGGGIVHYSVSMNYGSPTCASMNSLYSNLTARAVVRARHHKWFVAKFDRDDAVTYLKLRCFGTGIFSINLTMSVDLAEKYRGLFAAMVSNVAITRVLDPTVRPRPRIEELPTAPSGFSDEQVARAEPKPKAAKQPVIDESGTTGAMKMEAREGPDMRADEVFENASGAVYVVKADRRLGSAVAISENELLTNCHVVADMPEVKIVRAKTELTAKVVSRNADADRCVLRTTTKLAKWVTVRPYDDIKVGERAITIGTPQGLELTAAEGIVSSKRVFNQSRVIQTSAPISQGSSGGGLFDARGHLLGITTFYVRGGQNLNFAVAAEEHAQDREESANR